MEKFDYDLTVGMIVKNEEETLERCLKSLLPLKKELKIQIIITDTGSSDNTKEIAKKYADEVIDFTWCDDFSKARNTGVERAKGRWFFFIDADEYFGSDIDDFIKFVKSKDSEKIDSAVITRRDYKNSLQDYDDFKISRLFNFTKEVRYFQGIIHEVMPTNTNFVHIESMLHHDGYLKEKKAEKLKRNDVLLKKAIKENPKDFKSRVQIILATGDMQERLDYSKELLEYSKGNSSLDIYGKFAICDIAACFNHLGRYNESIKFIENNIAKLDKKGRAYLEVSYLYLFALKNVSNLIKITEWSNKFQNCYKYVLKNPDNVFETLRPVLINFEKEYFMSFITLANAYITLNEEEKAYKIISELDISEYENNDKFYLMEEYFVLAIKNKNYTAILNYYKKIKDSKQNRVDFIRILENVILAVGNENIKKEILSKLADEFDGYTALLKLRSEDFKEDEKYLNLILKDDLLYTNEYFRDALYFNIKNGSNKCDFINNCKSDKLIDIISKLAIEKDDFSSVVYNSLKTANITDSINELFYYKNILYYAMTSRNNSLDNKELSEMFEWFLSVGNLYNMFIYNEGLNEIQIKYINKTDAVVFVLHPAFINKDADISYYVGALKMAISLDEDLADILKIQLDEVQNKLNENKNAKNEFSALGEQIKSQINVLILEKRKEEAVMLLKQYEKINPNDAEIKDIYTLLN